MNLATGTSKFVWSSDTNAACREEDGCNGEIEGKIEQPLKVGSK